MLTINELPIAFPHQICLELSRKSQDEAWASVQQNYSNDAARWNAYLNQLCIDTLLPYIQAELELEASVYNLPSANLASTWEVVNGTAISIDSTRIVIIPSETDTDEFCVPQEWVDIPTWLAPYYLAVQVNLDDGWLRVWGYTTHLQLKTKGSLNRLTLSCDLDRDDMIDNLDVLWVALETCDEEKAQIALLPPLSASESEKLLDQLSQPSPYSPRLDISSEQWQAFIADPSRLQHLYLRRTVRDKVFVNLSQWIQGTVESIWQVSKSMMNVDIFADVLTKIEAPSSFAFAVRGRSQPKSIEGISLIDFTNDSMQKREKLIQTRSIELKNLQVALLIKLLPQTETEMNIYVAAIPTSSYSHLPNGLTLSVLNEDGNPAMESQANKTTQKLLYNFGGEVGEHFSIKLTLDGISIIREFIV